MTYNGPLWLIVVPLIIILFLIIIIWFVIYLIRWEDRRRWWTQDKAYAKWLYEDHSLKEARDIVEKLIDERKYMEAQRFIHEIMKDRSLSPGTFSWYFFRYTYAMSKYNRYFGRKKRNKKVREAIKMLDDLQYDSFVMSDPEALLNVRNQIEIAKAQKDLLQRIKETKNEINKLRKSG